MILTFRDANPLPTDLYLRRPTVSLSIRNQNVFHPCHPMPVVRPYLFIMDNISISMSIADVDTQKYHGIYLNSLYPIEVEITDSFLVVLRGIFDNKSFSVELLVGEDLDSLQLEILEKMGYHPQEPAAGTLPETGGRGLRLQYGLHICDDEANFGQDLAKISADIEEYLRPEFLQKIPYDSHCLTERVVALNTRLPK